MLLIIGMFQETLDGKLVRKNYCEQTSKRFLSNLVFISWQTQMENDKYVKQFIFSKISFGQELVMK